MNFDLTDDQQMVRDTFARFLDENSSTDRVRAAIGTGGFDAALWTGLAELGRQPATRFLPLIGLPQREVHAYIELATEIKPSAGVVDSIHEQTEGNPLFVGEIVRLLEIEGALEEIAGLVAEGRLRVPIAASFPVDQIRTAVELQAARHVRGKVVIDLQAQS